MEVMLSETVTRYYVVKMSDELDVETVLDKANAIRSQYASGHEAIDAVLKEYREINGNEFDYAIGGSSEWDKAESPIGFEYEI